VRAARQIVSGAALAEPAGAMDNLPMPIIGHGIDLVEVARIGRMHADHGRHFLDRCFTPAEQAYCLDHKFPETHLAGRFAAKEAILKVLGTGWRGPIAWTDMEILNNQAGKPELTLGGECARIAAELGIRRWHVTITHTQAQAMASAIGEG
jgi:holo-[acyl-carrier protein] synthase